jgi:hypothetical protein
MKSRVPELHALYRRFLKKHDSLVFGLEYIPSLEPEMSDDVDAFVMCNGIAPGSVSWQVSRYIESIVSAHSAMNILEIGVNAHPENSMTKAILENCARGSKYFGIDLEERNVDGIKVADGVQWVIARGDSSRFDDVCDALMKLNMKPLDMLVIDGLHSVNQVVRDFRYASLVKHGGIVLMHDILDHPGGRLVFDAVDSTVFTKEVLCPEGDWGLGILTRC